MSAFVASCNIILLQSQACCFPTSGKNRQLNPSVSSNLACDTEANTSATISPNVALRQLVSQLAMVLPVASGKYSLKSVGTEFVSTSAKGVLYMNVLVLIGMNHPPDDTVHPVFSDFVEYQ